MEPRTDSSPPPSAIRPGSVTWREPRILVCQSPVVQTEPAIRAYYASITAALSEGSGPYVMISDTRHVRTMPDALARRLHAHLAETTIGANPRRCLSSFIVVDGELMRAILTAIRWLIGTSTVPSVVVGSFEEAIRAARARL